MNEVDDQLAGDLLKVSEERYRLLADNANDIIWTMSLDGRITYVSRAVERVLGLTPSEVTSGSHEWLEPPETAKLVTGYLAQTAEQLAAGKVPNSFHHELEIRRKDGTTGWLEIHVMPHLDVARELIEILGVARDITEHRRQQTELLEAQETVETYNRALQEANAELARLATTDPLTGISNRRHFDEMAASALALATRYHHPLAMFMIDIDRFKPINDNYGHQAGDLVLIQLTEQIRSHLRGTDVLARWGGEEFIVMMPHCDLHDALDVAERVRQLVAAEPFMPFGQVTISVGAGQMRPGETVEELVSRIDVALYEAKESGRNAVRAAPSRLGDDPVI